MQLKNGGVYSQAWRDADAAGSDLDEILGPPERRAKLWDEMDEGKPANR